MPDFRRVGHYLGTHRLPGREGAPNAVSPLILAFNSEDKVVKGLLKQADFPDAAREEPAIGDVSFGLSNDKVWFWQPARHRTIIAGRGQASTSREHPYRTPAPGLSAAELS
jgi:hypothetical protein